MIREYELFLSIGHFAMHNLGRAAARGASNLVFVLLMRAAIVAVLRASLLRHTSANRLIHASCPFPVVSTGVTSSVELDVASQ